jgi:hypothetical protein
VNFNSERKKYPMYYYQLSDRINAENLEKLIAQTPSQAGAILRATWELGTNERAVSEDEVIDKIQSDLARFSPRAKGPDVVPGFVAYYRQALGKLPESILKQTKDNSAGKTRGGRGGGLEFLLDPITGEQIPNVFKREPTKNPGSRKTKKIVTEEYLEEEEEMPELEEGNSEAEAPAAE